MLVEYHNQWRWVLREPNILHPWFDDYQRWMDKHLVKRNPVRTVFYYEDYFIKLDRPETLWHRLRAYWRPKAAQEFNLALQLEQAGVPVVKYLAWGRCGSSTMLVTRAFPQAVTVSDYWLNNFLYAENSPQEFLSYLATFLRQFFAVKCYHPDLHLGNILYNPIEKKFALVDLYGVSAPGKRLSTRQKLRMFSIATALRRVLSPTEAADFLEQAGMALPHLSAVELWQKLLDNERKRIQHEWPKRRRQIIAEYDKYMQCHCDESGKYLFRLKPNRQPYTEPKRPLPRTVAQLVPLTLTNEQAEQIWTEAFLHDFLGDEAPLPLVWQQPPHSPESILYFSTSEQLPVVKLS